MRKRSLLLLASAFLISSAVFPAHSQDWHERRDERGRHEERHEERREERHVEEGWRWHGDIHHFHDYDYDYWRGGRWVHEFHEGRIGWWWVTGGFWYFYPEPVYPYPDPFTPPGIVVEAAPAGVASANYYCASPAGYYPYIAQCAVAWQRVVSAQQQVVVTQAPPQAVVVQPPAPTQSERDVDFRQLNVYADEFHHIDSNTPHASDRLKVLARKVEAFRKSLYKKSYNAMDLLKDTEDLKDRIAAQKRALSKHIPTALPPGSTVVFPAQ